MSGIVIADGNQLLYSYYFFLAIYTASCLKYTGGVLKQIDTCIYTHKGSNKGKYN